ncbi:MAG: hypothetical protein V4443_08525 [Pseudomonadota bacterium]
MESNYEAYNLGLELGEALLAIYRKKERWAEVSGKSEMTDRDYSLLLEKYGEVSDSMKTAYQEGFKVGIGINLFDRRETPSRNQYTLHYSRRIGREHADEVATSQVAWNISRIMKPTAIMREEDYQFLQTKFGSVSAEMQIAYRVGYNAVVELLENELSTQRVLSTDILNQK